MENKILRFIVLANLYFFAASAFAADATDNPKKLPFYLFEKNIAADTVPLKDRKGDFISNPSRNPFDLKDPSLIKKEVTFDPITGKYIVTEKIGDDDFRPPVSMTFDEYTKWRAKEQEKEYFNRLAGVRDRSGLGKGLKGIDPIAKFDLKNSLIDRLFGGTTVDIRPQGNVDLTFGVNHQNTQNPVLTLRQQRQTIFDFDMRIQMNVTGKIGEKLNLSTNYNTQAVFDFENQMKLNYKSDKFSEDEIIKSIDAGNVTLPLRSQLIHGAQSLFGIKTELQFGRLRVTGVASQQRSRRQQLSVQGGAQVQTFSVQADQYDENRHFFISHFNREHFEGALKTLPLVNSFFRINRIEVWITNDRNETQNVRDVVALADLGESSNTISVKAPSLPVYPDPFGSGGLPDNKANSLYQDILDRPNMRYIDNAVSTFLSPPFRFQQTKDFEKVRARRLSATEFSYDEQLGYISINVNLRPDQVLGVAYEYTYNGKVYQVGELSQQTPTNEINSRVQQGQDTSETKLNVLFVKLLKASTPRVDLPLWRLMMKNVYSIGALQVNRQDFKLDIYYEDPGAGQKRFLPETNLAGQPLLRVFNLDKLNVQGDPYPDGVFDFVERVTINTKTGRVMFPVLEPFGRSLTDKITDPSLKLKYGYYQLYDSTITAAREFPEFNRFTIRGTYKSSVSSEIDLKTFNLPRGSVKVSVGGQQLTEGQDFDVDYGIGRVKILREDLLSAGLPVNISFEDNTLFGFQTRAMVGTRLDYEVNKTFHIGGTYMNLFERPFTQKVNIGDDPINNKVYGLDVNYSHEAPWLTKLVDKIPLINTKAPSSIAVVAEGAYLQPGHAKAINQNSLDPGGAAYLDDFEGSTSNFDLRAPANAWVLASVPQNDNQNNNPLFPESGAQYVNNTMMGTNRARLNWYRIDFNARNESDNNDPYTKQVDITQIFKNRFFQPGQITTVQSFDLHFEPDLRGPYNFDIPGGTLVSAGLDQNGRLNRPETRWAGIMRALNQTDFEAANIEFIEFWMLSPFLFDTDPKVNSGNMYINLGNTSEDILRDSRLFFENGLPGTGKNSQSKVQINETKWSRIPVAQAITNAFDTDNDVRQQQDVGLDGIDDEKERTKFKYFLDACKSLNPPAFAAIESDPSNDNFKYFGDKEYDKAGVFTRYSRFNNPQGNSQTPQDNTFSSGTNIPDTEDINKDNTLNEAEAYYQYKIPLAPDGNGGIAKNEFISDIIEVPDQVAPGGKQLWYRFKIPITQFTSAVGGIRDFRAIRFIRMYLKDFRKETTLRFAEFNLVRNQWRRYRKNLKDAGPATETDNDETTLFDVNAVNIEQHSGRTPFNYLVPPGINRERSLGAFPDALQNEQSMSINTCNLKDGDARAIFKNFTFDMRVFDRIKMFVHGESKERLNTGDMRIFMRMGSDYENNYYEYEIPLTLSDATKLGAPESAQYRAEVWRAENNFDFPLDLLKNAKLQRNNDPRASVNAIYEIADPDNPQNKVRVKGNPNLGFGKGVMIGIRNPRDNGVPHCAEVWVNELRIVGFDERGGGAAIARVDMKLADFGKMTVSGNYSSIGWGGLDQRVAQRNREEIKQYDISANLELGKFFGDKSGIKLPVYAQYSNATRTPQFDPYDLDIEVKEKLRSTSNSNTRDSIRNLVQNVTEIRSLNFTDVRKERTGKAATRTPFPWDIENFSISYAFNETAKHDPFIEDDRQTLHHAQLNYDYALPKAASIMPFKKLVKNDKYLKFISEFNFNPVPNSFSFSTSMDRFINKTKYRFAGDDPEYNTFYNKRFLWDRNYNLRWDITKGLKITFNARNQSVIDEPEGAPGSPGYNKLLWENIKNWGRPKQYTHDATAEYTLPTKQIPFMDWIQVRAQVGASYGWNAAALNLDTLGHVIRNRQTRQINGEFNFEQLYNQWKYLKKINQPLFAQDAAKKGKKKGKNDPVDPNAPQDQKADAKGKKKKKEREYEPSVAEKILLRPLMTLRRARITYSENFDNVLPGFMPVARLLGQQDLSAPGWGFIFGQTTTNQWLENAAQQNWISRSVYQNQQVQRNYDQNISGTATLEPFNEFKVEIEANKTYRKSETETFRKENFDPNSPFVHLNPRENGAFTVSYLALQTLNGDIFEVFKQLEKNRIIISQRLGINNPEHAKDAGFREGYGKTQLDVLIPSFIAAYTKQDANTVGLDVFKTNPRPNWRLTYNGLGKLPWLKDVVQNINITHGYRSTLGVNSYLTNLRYDGTAARIVDPIKADYYARYDIPSVNITEQFSPLIGIDARLKNDMSIRMDYKKSRNLAMSFVDNQLAETKTSDITIGIGYRLRDVNIGFLQFGAPQSKKITKKKSKKGTDKKADPNEPKNGQVQDKKGSDLNLKFDFSLRDDITLNHVLDLEQTLPSRGMRTIRISPSADYQINRQITLRFFFDYNRSIPKTSASFPITTIRSGLTLRFTLQ